MRNVFGGRLPLRSLNHRKSLKRLPICSVCRCSLY